MKISSNHPSWAVNYLTEEQPKWDGWRNSLRPAGAASHKLILANESKTDYVIVIPEQATLPERRSAEELRLWLGKITGASFPIVADAEPEQEKELSVGRTNRVTSDALARLPARGAEGYTIAVEGKKVFLLGNGLAGPLYATFALLEEDFGVRWYFPGLAGADDWHDYPRAMSERPWHVGDYRVPNYPTLKAAIVPRTSQPAIPIRVLGGSHTYNPWGIRNRVNGGYADQYGQYSYVSGHFRVHTFHRLVPPEKYFESNPEYYSLIDGERRWEQAQLCLSNPEVAAIVAARAVELLSNAPINMQMINVSPEDWLNDCQCADCRAIEEETGSYSGVLLTFVNRIAELVEREVPEATITTLAYRQSKKPPLADMKARDNVAVWFCTDFGSSFNWPYHSFYDAKIADQKKIYQRWQEISDRMHLWIYPHQYANRPAPMPSIRPTAENIKFFHQTGAEYVYVQQLLDYDVGRDAMRYWIFAKLMWDPYLDVEELIHDFIWGYYGESAPDVLRYNQLLVEHCIAYTDFNRERNWIYAVDREQMYRHGFIDQAREILDRAMNKAENPDIRARVERLKLGIVYVEAVQLFVQMRHGETVPDMERYQAIQEELREICDHQDFHSVGYYEIGRSYGNVGNFLEQMTIEADRRHGWGVLPAANWGAWTFRTDPENVGLEEQWYDPQAGDDHWREIEMPSFWAQTWVGGYLGYGWYRTTFELPEDIGTESLTIEFGGVDEQAWVYVNGQYAGEHTVDSEFMVGEEVTVDDLWNRAFTINVDPELLRPGTRNHLVVRVHATAFNGGIHQPVTIFIPDSE